MEELEVWVEGYEGEYSVTNMGNVYSYKYGGKRPLSANVYETSTAKYKSVTLSRDNIGTVAYVHRLVAKAFIENPENKAEVNHIDSNKLNNHYENLEWNTPSENITHAWNTGLRKINRDEQKERRTFQLMFEDIPELEFNYYRLIANKDMLLKEGIPSKILSVRNPQRIPLKTFWNFLKSMCEDFMSDMSYKELEMKYGLTKSGVSRIRNKNRALEMWSCYDEWLEMGATGNNSPK